MYKQQHNNSLVISYLTLRKMIGLLGSLFPFVLYFGGVILFDTGLQPSVSHYYYTGMGDVFVGILFVIGFFLYSYQGYNQADNIAGNLGCIFALGIALFPTHATEDGTGIIGYIHLVSAALFFLTLIYFSLFLFTKTEPGQPPTKKKYQRNLVYKACGYVMGLCILSITIYFLLPEAMAAASKSIKPVFWFEAIAVIAFGISWLTKGEAILKDEFHK